AAEGATRAEYGRDSLLVSDKQEASIIFHEIKLFPKIHHNFFPVCSVDSMVYFVSRRGGNDDIWAIDAEGSIPRLNSAFLQFEFAATYFPLKSEDLVYDIDDVKLSQEELRYRLLAFQRVLDYFPVEHNWVGWALYEIGKTYTALGKNELARSYFHEILDQFHDYQEIVVQTRLRLFQLDHKIGADQWRAWLQQLEEIGQESVAFAELQAEALLYQAEILYLERYYSEALKKLEILLDRFPHQTEICARAQLLIGDIFSVFGQTQELINAYLKVMQNYPEEELLVNVAMSKILTLQESEDVYETLSNYRNLISRHSNYRRLAARTQYRVGELFFLAEDFDASIEELMVVAERYPDQKEEVAQTALLLGEVFLKRGDPFRATKQLRQLIDSFGGVQGGLYVVAAKERLFEIYVTTGDQFRNAGEFQAAYTRYRSALEVFPRSIDAHRRMISMIYALGRIDEGIKLYENLLNIHPEDEIYWYMLGLCFSYKATEKSERTKKLTDIDFKLMQKSNQLIQAALSKNYRLIQAYLTLSYNYEFIEKYQTAKMHQPRTFMESLVGTVITPIKSIFQWLTLQREKESEHWFEKAIEALTTAIALNDEKDNPLLESELALNLASNYYNLKEFGFERAYYYYKKRLAIDSTFVNKKIKAEIYKRMGHCALGVEDFRDGPGYLLRAISLYHDLGDMDNWLLNVKRLALLYQLAEDYDLSIEYFKMAAEEDERQKNYNQLEVNYRSIAYNFQLLNDQEEAIRYGRKALALIESNKVDRVEPRPNWIKIGILNVEIPIWNLGQIGAGGSTAAEGFTTDEEVALIYSILGQAAYGQRSIGGAIDYLEKRLEIYQKRKDSLAEAILLNNIAYLNYIDCDYQAAWYYYEQSLQRSRKAKNLPGTLTNMLNLATLGVIVNQVRMTEIGQNPDWLADSEIAESRTHIASLRYLKEANELIADNELGFNKERIEIYLLLGSLHLQSSLSRSSDLDTTEVRNFENQLQRFEGWAAADSFFVECLKLAKRENAAFYQMCALRKLGFVSYLLGDYVDALNKFFEARKLALQRNYQSSLWKINYDIGCLLVENNQLIGNDQRVNNAGYYLNQAIESLEEGAYQRKSFRSSIFYQQQVRSLFETAVWDAITNGNELTALRYSEQYRGRKYIDLLSDHKLQLKKERHKIFLGNARFLQKEIYELELKIRKAQEQEKSRDANYETWIRQKRNYEQEYQHLLVDLKAEDPELESFIHTEPVTYRHIQEILDDKTLMVSYFSTENRLFVWSMDQKSIHFEQRPYARKEFQNILDSFISRLENGQLNDQIGEAISSVFLDPIKDRVALYQTIVFVPDEAMFDVPFGYLTNCYNSGQMGDFKVVTIAPSMSTYYYSYQKRKIKEHQVYTSSLELGSLLFDLGYDVSESAATAASSTNQSELISQMIQNANVIVINSEIIPDKDYLMSLVRISDSAGNDISLKLRDLYSLDLNASLIVVSSPGRWDANLGFLLMKALIYAGSPTLIFSTEHNLDPFFWEYYFEALLDYPPAEALARVQQRKKGGNIDLLPYVFSSAVGFEGMNEAKEIKFAEERFWAKVSHGNKYYEEKKWEDAVFAYEQALVMAKKQGNVNAIENLQEYILYSAANGAMWEKAIEYQRNILAEAKQDGSIDEVIKEYKYLIYFYTQGRYYEKAIMAQKEYLALSQQYGLSEETANAYHRLGLIQEQERNFIEAEENLGFAIREYRQLGDSLKVAECLKDRGRIYMLNLDNYSLAIEDQKRALLIYQSFGNEERSIELLQNLGLSNERLANYQTALKYQMEALTLAKRFDSSLWVSLSKQHLANVYWKMGGYQQALKYQTDALKDFEEMKQLKLQSVALATYGLILLSLGDPESALIAEKKALSLAEQVADLQDMATIHKNINLIYRSQNQWADALKHIQLAIELDQKIGSERGLSYDYRDLGVILAKQDKADEALSNFRKALKISQRILDGRNIAQCLYEIGKIHYSAGRVGLALDSLSLASQQAEALFVPEVQWRALRMIGMAYRSSANLQQSMEAYKKALDVIETMRSQIKVEEFKSGFIDDKLDVYSDLVQIYLELNRIEEALQVVERAKSRNFVDMLANKDIQFGGEADQKYLQAQTELQEEISRVQHKIAAIRVKAQMTRADEQQMAQLSQRLEQLKKEYTDLLVTLKQQNPELADLVTVDPVEITSVMSMLPDSVAILEYYYTAEKIFAWTVTNHSIQVQETEFSLDTLFASVDAFRVAIEKQLPVSKISNNLYSVLIKPIEKSLAKTKHLVIVPHGVLHYLPFAALLNDDSQYLLDKFSLSLSPSAMVLSICMEKGDAYLDDESWQPNILAFGNPKLEEPGLELPFAEKEIESVGLLYQNVTPFLFDQATETNLKLQHREASLFIFSCHGEFDTVSPLFSALLLAADDENDGRLEAHEIFGLDLNAYLVSMSACETGLAKIGAGDEVIGLSRSFIYAGSSSLLSSLWKVDDLATAVMMKRFFRYVKQRESRSKALQKASLFVKNNINEHPLFWAAFNITGDFR
ncbi:MAG TPA: CHAT domain-containing protein, partial [bacterium]|nr:CHAT domain-containing protein [bacterium]